MITYVETEDFLGGLVLLEENYKHKQDEKDILKKAAGIYAKKLIAAKDRGENTSYLKDEARKEAMRVYKLAIKKGADFVKLDIVGRL